jgi:carbon storage regulator CsrA
MLVLSRKNRQAVVVGGGGGFEQLLKVTVVKIGAGKVKLGFEIDSDVPVHRLEIWQNLSESGELQEIPESWKTTSTDKQSPRRHIAQGA